MGLFKSTLLLELAENLTAEQEEKVEELEARIDAGLREYYTPGGFVEIDLDEIPEREVLAAVHCRYLDWDIMLQECNEVTVTDDPGLDRDDQLGKYSLLFQ